MDAQQFRRALTERMQHSAHRVLLRVALPPHLDEPVEFTGAELEQTARQLAREHAHCAGSA